MTATLRTILEQPLADTSSDLSSASVQLTRALVEMAPAGCDVAALAPAGDESAAALIPGLRELRIAPLQRRELLAAWQLGVGPGGGGGLVHSPTIAAPLVRHDRSNGGEQTVVTLWDLRAWEAPTELHRGAVAWQRGMMKRVVRHADALVVPTFAHADRVQEEWRMGDRIRVIPGAAPAGFAVPNDVVARRRDLLLPEAYVAVAAEVADSDGLGNALRAARSADLPVVVFHAREGDDLVVRAAAAEAGLAESSVHVLPVLDAADRAVVLAGARALLSGTTRTTWPWRALESLTVGTPVVAVASPVLTEVVGDGGATAPADVLGDALGDVLARDERMLRVLAADRGRSFSWASSAERVWQLHAEL